MTRGWVTQLSRCDILLLDILRSCDVLYPRAVILMSPRWIKIWDAQCSPRVLLLLAVLCLDILLLEFYVNKEYLSIEERTDSIDVPVL